MATRDPQARRGARDARLQEAVAVVLARQERKEHPRGTWQGGLWWPDPEERRACCETIRPTPANKQALESHCRSQAHVAHLFGVPGRALRRAALEIRRERAAAARLAGAEPPAGSRGALEGLLLSAQTALENAKTDLRVELGRLSPLLDRELAAEAETLTELLAVTGNLEKHLELFRRLVEMCREAQSAEQAYRQLPRPA